MDQVRQAHARFLTVDGYVHADEGARFLARMKAGGLDAAFFVVSVDQGDPAPSEQAKVRATTLEAVRRIRQWVEGQPQLVSFAQAPEDAYRRGKEGRHAAYLGLGNAHAIGSDLALIAALYEEGVRYLTLCGLKDNAVCDSAYDRTEQEDRGLSEFGRRVVAACNEVGMLIDLANCSERSFSDVLDSSRAPVIVSHTAARAICDRPGNLSAEMIKAIAAKGGVVMVSFEPDRLVARDRASRATIADIVDHIDYMKDVAGLENIGIGSCFGSGGGVSGCRDTSEILNLTLELFRRGYGEHAVESIWGGNTMRVLKEAESLAGKK